MQLAHKIALSPKPQQRDFFRQAAGTARFTYNWALAQWKAHYEQGYKPNGYLLKREFNAIRRTEFPWTYEVHRDATARPFMDLQRAFKNFFAGKAHYPVFKKKGQCQDSFYVACDKLRVEGKHVVLPKVGKVKMREPLRFSGKICGARVSREADRWFIALQVEVGDYHQERTGKGMVGVDLGIKSLATLSTGEQVAGPKPLAKVQKQLRRANRRLHGRKKGSANRRKAAHRVARLHYRVKNIRQDTLHKLSTRLCRENQAVSIEDLNVKGMQRNRKLARGISDMGWGELRRQLMYKALIFGTVLNVIGQWEPSSKTCSQCGAVKGSLSLSERLFVCNVSSSKLTPKL
jgi:putative transposase